MTKYDGGYLLLKQPLIKTGTYTHTADLENPVSPLMLRAVNIVQAVPWRINTFVLDVMREAYVRNDTIGDLPPSEDIPVPPRLPDDVWIALPAEARKEHKTRLSGIHSLNAGYSVKREVLLRKLQTAEEMRNREAIWFPHNLDFRGRMYPLPQDLNPQSDDVGRSLLMFSEGKRIGPRGHYWLMVAIANAFGQDKLNFEDRIEWVRNHTDALIDSALNPLEGRRFWTTAEEPWTALALCHEFNMMSEYGHDHVTHIPIAQDGSCNGLQHLSAMGRDPVGALATNLTSTPSKQDLYSEVAREVARIVGRDAAAGVEEARHWAGRVDRKVVKRAVMTTPYGVTERGIRDQLIADRHTEGLDGYQAANADYLKGCIVQALENTVRSAKDIMTYIQGTAKALADAGIPLRWITPAGMTVQQAYYNKNRKKVYTIHGEAIIWAEDKNLGLNVRKQALASAPNVIHSFDAAHLAKTVVEAHDVVGIKSFAVIHDSYGTHAPDVDDLARILREQFVDIYSGDRLAEFEEGVREYAPGVKLPRRPAGGDFNVTEVLNAPYFFS